MKRLVGGLILLNLTAISLGLSAGEVDITDADVLKQLTELRGFIDEKRDFTKGFKDLKPVLVQYRSSASKIDGIVECNLSFNTDALHMSIAGFSVQKDGTPITITINVVYEWTDYIGYTIKTAKLNATNGFVIDGQPVFAEWNGGIVEKTGITKVGEFCKVVRNFKELQFICNCRLTNTTESTISYTNDTVFCIYESLPNDILEKIYAHDGQNLKDADGSKSIAYAVLFVAKTNGVVDSQNPQYLSLYYDKTVNSIRFYIEGGNGLDVEAGQSLDIEARISLAI